MYAEVINITNIFMYVYVCTLCICMTPLSHTYNISLSLSLSLSESLCVGRKSMCRAMRAYCVCMYIHHCAQTHLCVCMRLSYTHTCSLSILSYTHMLSLPYKINR